MNDDHRLDGAAPGRDPDGSGIAAGEPAPLAELPPERDADAKRSAHRANAVSPRRSAWVRVALGVALLAAGAAAVVFWQHRALERARAGEASAEAALAALQADLVRVEERVGGLSGEVRAGLEADARGREALAARLEAFGPRLVDLDRRVAAAQGVSFDARRSWLRAEAEYYLTVASAELALAGRWQSAIAALDLADERLAELADPTLAPVREAIAGERLAVTSVRLPDLDRVAFDLGELASRAQELPLRAELPQTYALPREPADQDTPGLARLVATIKSALLGLVRIERRQTAVAPELTAAQRLLARRELGLELAVARAAVVDGRQNLFVGSLERALDVLRRDFDTTSAEVERAIALLEGFRALDVDPERPVLGRGLSLLRGIAAGER